MNIDTITEKESELIHALCDMCIQYLERGNDYAGRNHLEDACMSAGQNALDILRDYGLVEDIPDKGTFFTKEAREWLKL
jgi:hypothetical protein